MKIRSKFYFLMVVILVMAGVCGCMKKQNDEAQMASMLKYATDTYGQDFTVVHFQAALDETYSNILTLTDGEHVFKVYQHEGGKATDDYYRGILNKKFIEYITEQSNSDMEIYGKVLWADGREMSIDYAMQNDVSTIIKDYELLKVIIIVKTDEDIEKVQEELYDIYESAMFLSPKYIDFEVIKVNQTSTELENMLSNITGYDNHWNRFPEIESYIRVEETTISSPAELVRDIKD